MAATKIRRRLFKGIGANLYGQIVVAAVQLIGVPILLHAWGTRIYAEWLILSAIPSYISLTNLGFSMSVANDMTKLVAEGNRTRALTVYQSLQAFILGASALLFAVVTTVIWVLPCDAWFQSSVMSPTAIRIVLWCLCSDVIIKLSDGLNHAGFRATGDYALHQTIYYSIILIQQALVWGLALAGHAPPTAAAFYVGFSLIAIPSTMALLTFRHRWLSPGLRNARFSELKRLSGPALGNMSGVLSNSLNIQGMTLVVAAILGPVQVVVLSTLRTMARLTAQLVGVVSMAAEPEFAALGARPDRAPLLKLYGHMVSASFWIAAGTVIALVIVGQRLLALWTHGRVHMDWGLFYWLLATVISQTIWGCGLALLRGRNQHMSSTLFQMFTALASLCLGAALLIMTHRLAFAGFSLFVMDVVFLLFVLRKVKLLYDIRIGNLIKLALDPRSVVQFVKEIRHV